MNRRQLRTLVSIASLLVPAVANAEVCDKTDCGSTLSYWANAALVSTALLVAWSTRLWIGALLTIPLLLVALNGVWRLESSPFGDAIRHELPTAAVAGAYLSPVLALAAAAAGNLLRVRRSSNSSPKLTASEVHSS